VKGEPEKKETTEKKEIISDTSVRDRAERNPPGLPSPSFITKGHVVFDDLIGIGTMPPVGASTMPGTLGFVRGVAGYSSSNGNDGAGGIATMHSVWLSPSGDYFLTPHLSIGARISGTYSEAQSGSLNERAYGASLVPRLGFFAALGPSSGVWMRGGLGGGFQTSEATMTGTSTLGGVGGLGSTGGSLGGLPANTVVPSVTQTSTTLHYWTAQADASYVVSIGAHLLVAAGPEAGYVYYAIDGNTPGGGSRFNLGGRISLGATF
jgi:hypothetical protein